MVRNKDRWSALSIRDRAALIDMYVKSGITDLREIRKDYNSFDDGGDIQNYKEKSLPGNWLQRLAYKFGSDPKVSSKGIASMEDILRILKSSEDIDWDALDNNKATYLFGNILGLFPAGETKGKDYSKYLKENYPLKYILGKIKEYKGTINPFNEYVVDSRDRGLVEELAKKGKGLYSNSDIEYSYMFDTYDTPPYKEDVANYHMQFVNTPNGISVSASDLYDFGKDYNPEDYDDSGNNNYNNLLTDIEVAAFTAVGNPYIYRQENIPIRFIDTNNNIDEEGTRALELSRSWNWANLSDEDLEKGISFDEKIANILDTGYIEPAVVTAETKKANGGKLNKFKTGGPKGAGQATYNHPKYNHKEEAAMYSYLRERGIPHTQASAIMGNIAVESMLDPNISQIGGGGGYGLIQATNKSRKKAFINYDGQPYEFGSDISPETQRQLDYIVDKGLNTFTSGEWRGNENIARARKARERFLKETNIDKASKIFTENYLRPGKPHEKRRRSMSRYFNDTYATTESALKEFENVFFI